MNLTIKSLILDAGLSVLFTFIGGGNFYSFVFFFILLFLPSILIFISIETITTTSLKVDNSIESQQNNHHKSNQ